MELNLTESAEYNLACSWWRWYASIVTTMLEQTVWVICW